MDAHFIKKSMQEVKQYLNKNLRKGPRIKSKPFLQFITFQYENSECFLDNKKYLLIKFKKLFLIVENYSRIYVKTIYIGKFREI